MASDQSPQRPGGDPPSDALARVPDQLWASILIEALPYIRAYQGARVVIKQGGHAMTDPELQRNLALDVALLRFVGVNPVVVHGGGPQIDDLLKKLGLGRQFVEGYRYTDEPTLDVVRMVLGGHLGKDIASQLCQAGAKALALTGQDGRLIQAQRKTLPQASGEELDIGLVGEPTQINRELLEHLFQGGIIPVISPVGVDESGQSYNINADSAAAAVAESLKAARLILMTDVPGVLGPDGRLISRLTASEIEALKKEGAISGGMLPKLASCLKAVKGGCQGAAIIDGRVPHAVLLELLTDHGYGTEVVLG
ncbi:MAG: acetylglutamate kinase [Deltaproteobacteria bacterium]|jgi:acetylglutamate kinase|nr:acetylglutamate kinase [Deltaproteobacteria bacterium]